MARRIDESAQSMDDAAEMLAPPPDADARERLSRAGPPCRRSSGPTPDGQVQASETAGVRLHRPEKAVEHRGNLKGFGRIESFNPALPLDRGFAIVTTSGGALVRGPSQLKQVMSTVRPRRRGRCTAGIGQPENGDDSWKRWPGGRRFIENCCQGACVRRQPGNLSPSRWSRMN